MQSTDEPEFVPLVEGIKFLLAPVKKSTIYAWASTGFRGRRLPTIKVGARKFVRPADVRKFSEEFNAPADQAGAAA